MQRGIMEQSRKLPTLKIFGKLLIIHKKMMWGGCESQCMQTKCMIRENKKCSLCLKQILCMIYSEHMMSS